jgi:hypothetical protein
VLWNEGIFATVGRDLFGQVAHRKLQHDHSHSVVSIATIGFENVLWLAVASAIDRNARLFFDWNGEWGGPAINKRILREPTKKSTAKS